MDPVSPYVLSDRATKYGLLFIALTFVGVGAVEVMRRLRVHPIQYLLVGSALAVFFLLLVSLSEHVPFAVAYLAAAAACTALLTFYGSFVLRGSRAGAAVRRRHRRPVRRALRAAAARADRAPARLDLLFAVLAGADGRDAPDRLVPPLRADAQRAGAAAAPARRPRRASAAPSTGASECGRSFSARRARRPRAGRSGRPRAACRGASAGRSSRGGSGRPGGGRT